MGKTTPTFSAPANQDRNRWIAYPILSEEEIYRRPLRAHGFRWPMAFKTEDLAKKWLEEPEVLFHDSSDNPFLGAARGATTWHGPIPERELASYTGAPLKQRCRLKELLNADPGESQEIDHYTKMVQLVNQQHHRVYCYLGSDWDFNSIWEQTAKSQAYSPWGRRVEGFAHQMLQVLFELESNLFMRHPRLPTSAVADFWLSWQVYLLIAVFCNNLAADPNFRRLAGDRSPEDVCEDARYFIGTELVRYTKEIEQSGTTLAQSGAVDQDRFVAKAWDQISIRFTDDHHVQVKIVDQTDSLSFASMGFEDRRGGKGKPVRAWEVLRAFAQKNGSIPRPAAGSAELRKLEKSVQDLRKRLRSHFKILGSPIIFDKKAKTYRTLFRVRFPDSERL